MQQPWVRVSQLILLLSLTALWSVSAQVSVADSKALADQAERRIRELQAEADRLASQARTLLGELRKLEIERQIKTQQLAKANAALAAVSAEVDGAAARLAALEAQRQAETPGVRERLVEIYKRGGGGYVRLLFAAADMRAFGRTSRGVAAIARLDRVRLEGHRRTIRAERDVLTELQARRTAQAAAQAEALKARQALDSAVAAYNRRLDELDLQRDVAARYVGELQAAQGDLQKTITALESATPALPIAPFRGALEWPLRGRVLSRFGRSPAGRFGTVIVRNGIEIAAEDGVPVRAVHPGTVAYASPFSGFGTLVILDHGRGAFSLYGHLSQAEVARGARVTQGETVGRAGRTPRGVPAAYFELRIDGRPVDPVQWLRSLR